ncbi:hypothetical protein CP880_00455 [Cutibacterium namnetense]|uniref:Uncharacterized protein n=1 Tax=Cutibacterium namnetense TaxID=1574624 RepID=A0ABX9IAK2_9ACTN|nr:hypothetical protein CP880_00455 [Cutibacterium namnetense]TKW70921.1 MAG: hypothetical protein DI580_10190 [Cutibacterium acnes]
MDSPGEMARVIDPDGSGGAAPSLCPLYPQQAVHTERYPFSAQRNTGIRGARSAGDKAVSGRVLRQPNRDFLNRRGNVGNNEV